MNVVSVKSGQEAIRRKFFHPSLLIRSYPSATAKCLLTSGATRRVPFLLAGKLKTGLCGSISAVASYCKTLNCAQKNRLRRWKVKSVWFTTG